MIEVGESVAGFMVVLTVLVCGLFVAKSCESRRFKELQSVNRDLREENTGLRARLKLLRHHEFGDRERLRKNKAILESFELKGDERKAKIKEALE